MGTSKRKTTQSAARKQPSARSRARPADPPKPSSAQRSIAPAREEGRLPRTPKGKRASFYPEPAVDTLLAVVTALTAEVSVAFDRITTLERLLEKHDLLPAGAVESYEPDEMENRRRTEARDALIERVFRVLHGQERAASPQRTRRSR